MHCFTLFRGLPINHENCKNWIPRKFPAIRYYIVIIVVNANLASWWQDTEIVRTYKWKTSTSYFPEALQAAVKAVKESGMSRSAAARKFNIPHFSRQDCILYLEMLFLLANCQRVSISEGSATSESELPEIIEIQQMILWLVGCIYMATSPGNYRNLKKQEKPVKLEIRKCKAKPSVLWRSLNYWWSERLIWAGAGREAETTSRY